MKKSQFKFPYVGSAVAKFQFRFNNYKALILRFRRN